MESERTGEYLEAIFKRQNQKSPVTTSSLAEDLKVSLPAVTDMLHHLKEQGLIDYRPNKGTTLTDLGTKNALGLIRRHRLWERFLTDILGMKWDKVHEEACKLEHIVSPEIEKGLATIIGDSNTCPHGQPIPDIKGNIKEEELTPLSNFKPGQKAYLQVVTNENPDLLRNMDTIGLVLKTAITILKRNKNGSMDIEINNKRVQIKSEMALAILARPLEDVRQNSDNEKIPLSKLGAGQSGIIKAYTGKRGMLGRCLSLGFTPGSRVKMMENHKRGPVLVKIHDSAIALGRGLAEKIVITRNEETC